MSGAATSYTLNVYKIGCVLTIKQSMTQPQERVDPAIMRAASTEQRTEFEQAVDGMPMDEVISLFSELMNTIQTINPKLYAAVMRRIV